MDDVKVVLVQDPPEGGLAGKGPVVAVQPDREGPVDADPVPRFQTGLAPSAAGDHADAMAPLNQFPGCPLDHHATARRSRQKIIRYHADAQAALRSLPIVVFRQAPTANWQRGQFRYPRGRPFAAAGQPRITAHTTASTLM